MLSAALRLRTESETMNTPQDVLSLIDYRESDQTYVVKTVTFTEISADELESLVNAAKKSPSAVFTATESAMIRLVSRHCDPDDYSPFELLGKQASIIR